MKIQCTKHFFPTFTVPETKTPRKQRHDRVFWGVLYFLVCRYVFVLLSLTPYAGISSSPNAFKISENTSSDLFFIKISFPSKCTFVIVALRMASWIFSVE